MRRMKDTKNTAVISWGPFLTLAVAIGVFFGGQLFGAAIVSTVLGVFGWSSQQIADFYTSSTIGQFVVMIAVDAVMFLLLYWFIRSRKSSLGAIGLTRPHLRDGIYMLLGAVMYFSASLFLTSVIAKLIPALNLEQQQQIGFEQASSIPQLALVFVALVILPPLIEEMLFRGFLFSGLRTKLPLILAALVTSVIFAAPHLQIGSGNPLLWVAFIDTFILSMVLVFVRVKSGTLWSSVGLHAIKNGVAFVLLFALKMG